MQLETDSVSKGRATAVSPLYPVLLGNDTRPVPEAFAAVGEWRVDAPSVDRSRYYDRAFAAAEMEHLWKKTWQVVGRSEDIPAVTASPMTSARCPSSSCAAMRPRSGHFTTVAAIAERACARDGVRARISGAHFTAGAGRPTALPR